jgi:peptide chain release factor 2
MKRCPEPEGAWTLSEGIFDRPRLETRIQELEKQVSDPAIWEDPPSANKLHRELSRLKDILEPLDELSGRLDEIEEYQELLAEEPNEEIQAEADQLAARFVRDLDKYELKTLLSGEHDDKNAILEINAGAGGTEACDWAEILLRMYMRWAEREGYKVELLSETPGDVTGYRNVAIQLSGTNAYGYSKAENGVHRLVRISPYDAANRRHTSFVKVEVLPEMEESEIEIDPEDLRIDTLRASGAGGQHVNKTESAVRITHEPSGIVVQCQTERSQHQNKATAMKVLTARLAEIQRKQDLADLNQLKGDSGPAEWGRQIRSYVMQPYTMVKDHRTGHETGNVQGVMDGDIMPFIEAFLKQPPKSEDDYVD